MVNFFVNDSEHILIDIIQWRYNNKDTEDIADSKIKHIKHSCDYDNYIKYI
jgi:hypothetical protein